MSLSRQFGFLKLAFCFYNFLTFSSNGLSTEYTFNDTGATFDVSPLTLSASGQLSYYTVWDSRYKDDADHNYTYEFNIGAAVINYPTENALCATEHTGAHGYCTSIASNGSCLTYVMYSSPVFAYQISRRANDSRCYRLSKEDGGPPTWNLLNEDNPSEGVVITYNDGDYCSSHEKNRQFRIILECENNYYNIPDSESIDEDSCGYNLTLKSIYGCPTQCGIHSNSLCNDQGECGYDWTNGYPKCFCYYGYTGYACSEEDTDKGKMPTYKQITNKVSDYYHTFTYTQTAKNSEGWSKNVNMTVTYDLSAFYLNNQSKYYFVQDTNKNGYEYYWQFMDNISSLVIPKQCENATASCNVETGNCTNVGSLGKYPTGAAFQLETNVTSPRCFLLGQANNPTWKLLDEDNPIKGVSITYNNGGYCPSHNSNRQFTIEFECPDSTHTLFNVEEETNITSYVKEDDIHACEYTMRIITALACPYQCITEWSSTKDSEGSTNQIDDANIYTKFTICNSRGVCGSDPNVNFTRCLCDDGWDGDYCETLSSSPTSQPAKSSDDHSGFKIAIGIIVALLVILLIVSLYLYMRNRSLRQFQASILEAEVDAVTQPHTFGASEKAPVRVPDRDYSDSEDDNQHHDKHEDDGNEMAVQNIELNDNHHDNNNTTREHDQNAV